MPNLVTNVDPNGDTALTALATFLKVRINSSLSVDDLKGLGRERLEGLKGKLKPDGDEFKGYSLNSHLDVVPVAVDNRSKAGADEFSGYSLNAHIEEKK